MTLDEAVQELLEQLRHPSATVPAKVLERPAGDGLALWLDAVFAAFSKLPSDDQDECDSLRDYLLKSAALARPAEDGAKRGSAEPHSWSNLRLRRAAAMAASALVGDQVYAPRDLAEHMLQQAFLTPHARGYRQGWPTAEPPVLGECHWQRILPVLLALERPDREGVAVRGMVAELKLWCVDSAGFEGDLAFVPAPASYLLHTEETFQLGLQRVRDYLLAKLGPNREDARRLAIVYDLRPAPTSPPGIDAFPGAVYGASASASFALGALHVLRAHLDDNTRFALEYLVDWAHLAVSATVLDAKGRLGPVYYLQQKAEAWERHAMSAGASVSVTPPPVYIADDGLAPTPLQAAKAGTVDALLKLAGEDHGHCTPVERQLLQRIQPPGKPGQAAQTVPIGTASDDLALLQDVSARSAVTRQPSVQSYLLRRYAACALGQAGVLTQAPMRLDLHFVNLTLGTDSADQPGVARDYDDLPSLLRRFEDPAPDETPVASPAAWLVRGDPGAGKTTLLRHYMMQSARAALLGWAEDDSKHGSGTGANTRGYTAGRSGRPELCIELRVANFPAAWPANGGFEAWLHEHLQHDLPELQVLRRSWRLRFVIDAVNETAITDPVRHQALMSGLVETLDRWAKAERAPERAEPDLPTLFSIRTLESSFMLQRTGYSVRELVVQRWKIGQMQRYCRLHGPRCEPMAQELESLQRWQPRLFELFKLPLNLAIQVELLSAGMMDRPANSRAELFTSLLWSRLWRERARLLSAPGAAGTSLANQVFSKAEHLVLDRIGAQGIPTEDRALLLRTRPGTGWLVRSLMQLGQAAQADRAVFVVESQARQLLRINGSQMDRLVELAAALHILKPSDDGRILHFVHQQLWQEFMTALELLEHPPGRWPVDAQRPAAWWPQPQAPDLPDPATIAPGQYLPAVEPPPWEEPVKLAVELALHTHQDAGPPLVARAWLEWLMQDDASMSWAGRAAGPVRDVLDLHFKPLMDDLRRRLRARGGQPDLDMRLRVEAGLALGLVGDPRYQRRDSPCRTLVPDDEHWVQMPAREYTIGAPQADVDQRMAWPDETPRTPVRLAAFQLAWAPVTNAEFACFIEDQGYGIGEQRPDWWAGEAAGRWWAGDNENLAEAARWRDLRDKARSLPDPSRHFSGFTAEFRRNNLPWLQQASDAEFERQLQEWFAPGRWRTPMFWTDEHLNNPAQPVVGISLYEARAYCRWLTERRGRHEGWQYRLPLEAEVEAVAQRAPLEPLPSAGLGWCNNEESRLGRTSPVGVFPGSVRRGTPAADLSGNVWIWTVSPYTPSLDRQALQQCGDEFDAGVARVVRSGAWYNARRGCRASCRGRDVPLNRSNVLGFRLVRCPIHEP